MQIKFSAEFKKSYKTRIQKNEKLKELFWETLELFDHDPFHTSLRTHRLSGSLEGKWAFSVDYDCRVVFHFISQDHVLLLDIGTHDQVY